MDIYGRGAGAVVNATLVLFEELGTKTHVYGEVVDYAEDMVVGNVVMDEGKNDTTEDGKGSVVTGDNAIAGIGGNGSRAVG